MAAPKVGTFTTGLVPLPAENVDTDQIVPARYLKVIDKAGLADALFHDWRFEADGSKKNPPFVIDEPRYAGHGILVAGDNFGTGSSRDWAAKGTYLLGIRAVLAESFERIHRSNLVGMGVLPLEFLPGENRETLGLTGYEVYDILGLEDLKPRKLVDIVARREDGSEVRFQAIARLDTPVEVDYYKNGGILQTVLLNMLKEAKATE